MVDRTARAKFWIIAHAIGVLLLTLLLYAGGASVFVSLLVHDVGGAKDFVSGPSRSALSYLDIKLSVDWASFAILSGVICVCVAAWSAAQLHRSLHGYKARLIIFASLAGVLVATTLMAVVSPGGTMAVPQALTCGRPPFVEGHGFLCGWDLELGGSRLWHSEGWVGAIQRLRLLSNILFQIAVICVLTAVVIVVSLSRWEEVSPSDREGAVDDRLVGRLFLAGGLIFSLRVLSQVTFAMWPIAVVGSPQLSQIMISYCVFFGVLGSSVLVCVLAFSLGALFEPRPGRIGDEYAVRPRAWSLGLLMHFLSQESTIKTVSTLAPVLVAVIGGPLLGKG